MSPQTLTVIIVDTWTSACNMIHLGETTAFKRRTVHIPLTPEQMAMIELRQVGESQGKPMFEEIERSWLEDKK